MARAHHTLGARIGWRLVRLAIEFVATPIDIGGGLATRRYRATTEGVSLNNYEMKQRPGFTVRRLMANPILFQTSLTSFMEP